MTSTPDAGKQSEASAASLFSSTDNGPSHVDTKSGSSPAPDFPANTRRAKGMSIGNAASLFGSDEPIDFLGGGSTSSGTDFFGKAKGHSPISAKSPFDAIGEGDEEAESSTADLFGSSSDDVNPSNQQMDWLGSGNGTASQDQGHAGQPQQQQYAQQAQQVEQQDGSHSHYNAYGQQGYQQAQPSFYGQPTSPTQGSDQYAYYNQSGYSWNQQQDQSMYWDPSQQQYYQQNLQSQAHTAYPQANGYTQQSYQQQPYGYDYSAAGNTQAQQQPAQQQQDMYAPLYYQEQQAQHTPYSAPAAPTYPNQLSRSQSKQATSAPTYAPSYAESYDPYAPSSSIDPYATTSTHKPPALNHAHTTPYASATQPTLSHSQTTTSVPQSSQTALAAPGTSTGGQKLNRSASSFFAELPPMPVKSRPTSAMGEGRRHSGTSPQLGQQQKAFQQQPPPPPPPKSRTPAPPAASQMTAIPAPRPPSTASITSAVPPLRPASTTSTSSLGNSSVGRPGSRTARRQDSYASQTDHTSTPVQPYDQSAYIVSQAQQQTQPYGQQTSQPSYAQSYQQDTQQPYQQSFQRSYQQPPQNASSHPYQQPQQYQPESSYYQGQQPSQPAPQDAFETISTVPTFSQQSSQTRNTLEPSQALSQPPSRIGQVQNAYQSEQPQAFTVQQTHTPPPTVQVPPPAQRQSPSALGQQARAFTPPQAVIEEIDAENVDDDKVDDEVQSLASAMQTSSISAVPATTAPEEDVHGDVENLQEKVDASERRPSIKAPLAVEPEEVDSMAFHSEQQEPSATAPLEPYQRSITLDAYLPPSPRPLTRVEFPPASTLPPPPKLSFSAPSPNVESAPAEFDDVGIEDDSALESSVATLTAAQKEAEYALQRAERELERELGGDSAAELDMLEGAPENFSPHEIDNASNDQTYGSDPYAYEHRAQDPYGDPEYRPQEEQSILQTEDQNEVQLAAPAGAKQEAQVLFSHSNGPYDQADFPYGQQSNNYSQNEYSHEVTDREYVTSREQNGEPAHNQASTPYEQYSQSYEHTEHVYNQADNTYSQPYSNYDPVDSLSPQPATLYSQPDSTYMTQENTYGQPEQTYNQSAGPYDERYGQYSAEDGTYGQTESAYNHQVASSPQDHYGYAPADSTYSQPGLAPESAGMSKQASYDPYAQPNTFSQSQTPYGSAPEPAAFNPYDPSSTARQITASPAPQIANGYLSQPTGTRPPVPIAVFGFNGRLVTFFPPAQASYSTDASYSSPYGDNTSATQSKVVIRKASDLLTGDMEALKAFPGPLFMESTSTSASGKTKKRKEVLTWLDGRIDESEKASGFVGASGNEARKREAESKTILMKLIKLLLENDGKLGGSPTSDEAVCSALVPNLKSNQAMTLLPTAADLHGKNSNQYATGDGNAGTPSAQPTDLDNIEMYLYRGQKREAVRYALDRRLWAHALVIAAGVDKELQASVTKEFIEAEVSGPAHASQKTREPLKVAYSLLSGAGASSSQLYFVRLPSDRADELFLVQSFIPPRSLTQSSSVVSVSALSAPIPNPYAPVSRAPSPTSGVANDIPAQTLSRWPDTAAMIVANRTSGDALALTGLGDALAANGWHTAAHCCYLLSPQTSALGGPSVPGVRYSLVGNSSPLQHSISTKDVDSIMLTEVIEFALSFIAVPKGQDVYVGLPHLQAYRYLHALELADAGLHAQAQKYCDAIGATLKLALKGSPFYHPTLLAQVKGLSDRLSSVSFKDKSGSWISRKVQKPTLDNVWSTLEGRFAKFVAGEAEEDPAEVAKRKQAEEAAKAVAGPFAHYSSITPQGPDSISRVPSFTEMRTTPPPQPTSVPNTVSWPTGPPKATHHRKSSSYGYGPYGADPYPPYVPNPSQALSEEPEPPQQSDTNYAVSYDAPQWGQSASNNEGGWYGSANGDYSKQPSYGQPTMYSTGADDVAGGDDSGFVSPMNAYAPSSASRYDSHSFTASAPPAIEEEEDDDLGLGNNSNRKKRDQLSSSEPPSTKRPQTTEPAAKSAAESEKKDDPTLKPAPSSSWLGRIFRRDASSPTGPIKAKLGEETSFVYDPVEKRWINKKAGAETPPPAVPAPPPRAQTASPTAAGRSNLTNQFATPPPAAFSKSAGITPPPTRSATTEGPLATSTPPPLSTSTPPPPAPTSRPSTSASGELPPPPRRPATTTGGGSRKNVRARYVDVFAQQQQGGA